MSASPERMIHDTNQIALFFASYPHDKAVAGVAEHIAKFWERRMKDQLFAYADQGGAGLHALVAEAISRLRQPQPAKG